MKWVDHPNYFGPDRRRAWFGVRVIERRNDSFSGPPPPLGRAMRQLRQYIIDAYGPRLMVFVTRVESTALLARMNNEPEVSARLMRLAAVARLGEARDMRLDLVEMLNSAIEGLRKAPEAANDASDYKAGNQF